MSEIKLSAEPYKWQANGRHNIGKLVLTDGLMVTRQGVVSVRSILPHIAVLVFSGLDEQPGLHWVKYSELSLYERGE